MALLFDGSNDYGTVTLDNSGVNKLTVSFWVNHGTYLDAFHLLMEATTDMNSNTTGFYCSADTPTTGRSDLTMKGDAGNTATIFNRPSVNTWHHYCLFLDKSLSTDEPTPYIDGAIAAAITRPTNNNNTNNFGNDPWYFMSRAGSSLFANAYLAEVAVYPAILSTDDCIALAKGATPLSVRPELHPWYWRMLGGSALMELFQGVGLTVSGAVEAALHPPIWFPE